MCCMSLAHPLRLFQNFLLSATRAVRDDKINVTSFTGRRWRCLADSTGWRYEGEVNSGTN